MPTPALLHITHPVPAGTPRFPLAPAYYLCLLLLLLQLLFQLGNVLQNNRHSILDSCAGSQGPSLLSSSWAVLSSSPTAPRHRESCPLTDRHREIMPPPPSLSTSFWHKCLAKLHRGLRPLGCTEAVLAPPSLTLGGRANLCPLPCTPPSVRQMSLLSLSAQVPVGEERKRSSHQGTGALLRDLCLAGDLCQCPLLATIPPAAGAPNPQEGHS